MDKKKLTTAGGAPVVDNQDVLTAGPRGPQLLQDVWFLEKMAHFDREVIPERRMHAKGSGAYGRLDRKSTRLNSSHVASSYAVFCSKKKTRLIRTYENTYNNI